MDLKDTYNKIAKDWHGDRPADIWWTEGAEKFVSLMKPGQLVLDVGCAGGLKSRYLINNGLKVVGIDIAEKFIEIAKKEVPEGKFSVARMEDIPKLESVFDAIFMQAVLLHIPHNQVKKNLEGAMTKLNKGGYFYVAVKEQKAGQPPEETKKENDYGYEYERFFSYFTLPQIKKLLTDIGLNVVYENVTLSGKTNWIQVIGKK